MNQKGFSPILIVLILAALVGGYLVYTNYSNSRIQPITKVITPTTPQPTTKSSFQDEDERVEDKRVYKHNNQWQISYPKDWYRLDSSSSTGSIGFSNGKDIPRGPEGSILVTVDWDIPSSIYDSALTKEHEKLQVNGYPAIKQVYGTPPGTPTEYTYSVRILVRGPKDVMLEALSFRNERIGNNSFKPSESFIKNDLPIFDKMISSFKLLP